MENKLPSTFIDELHLKLLNTGQVDVGQEWNYRNITSPFSRLYLITQGEGYILPNNKMHQLRPGRLYLIPSFTPCSYHCVDRLNQYYIHFTNQFQTGLNIYDINTIIHETRSFSYDIHLFERLIELNPNSSLTKKDPKEYEKDFWKSNINPNTHSKNHLETIGILKQLLSRFLDESIIEPENLQQFCDFRNVFQFINSNFQNEIKIETLAGMMNYSYDHFTRIFKKTTGMLPLKYINMKRIEKAQILLSTTRLSQQEICDQTGFNHLPYYYRVFQKQVGCTPAKYRKMGGLV